MTRNKTIVLNEFNINKQKMKSLQKDLATLLIRANNTDDILGLIEIWDKNDVYKKRMLELELEQQSLIKEYSEVS